MFSLLRFEPETHGFQFAAFAAAWQHRRPPLVRGVGLHVLESERKRVHARRDCQHVDRLRIGKRHLLSTRSTQRAAVEDAHRRIDRLAHQLVVRVDDLHPRRAVLRVGSPAVDLARDGVGRRRRSADRARKLAAGVDRRSALTEPGRLVRRDVPVGVDTGTHVVEVRRPVMRPAMLVPAHHLQTHRLAERLRHDRRRLGRVERHATVAERPRALVEDHPDLIARSGDSTFARSVMRLSTFWVLLQIVAPVAVNVGDRTARPDRHVTLVMMGERTRHRVRRRGERSVDVALQRVPDRCRDLPLRVEVAVVPPQVARSGKDRVRVPHDLELSSRLDRVVLLRRNHTEEVVHMHDLSARNMRDRRSHRRSPGRSSCTDTHPDHAGEPSGRGASPEPGPAARTCTFPVTLSGMSIRTTGFGSVNRLVRRHRLRRSDTRLQRDVRTSDRSTACRRRAAPNVTLLPPPETTPLSTVRFATGTPRFAEAMPSRACRASAPTLRIFGPVPDIAFEPPSPPELDGDAGVDDRVAAPLLNMAVVHLRHVHVELFGQHLQEAGRDAVADLDLARLQRHRVIGADRDPRVDLVRCPGGSPPRVGGGGRAALPARAEPASEKPTISAPPPFTNALA